MKNDDEISKDDNIKEFFEEVEVNELDYKNPSKKYHGITTAGYQMLHRQMWLEIIKGIETKQYIGKEEVCKKYGYFDIYCLCFACEEALRRRRQFSTKDMLCRYCPILRFGKNFNCEIDVRCSHYEYTEYDGIGPDQFLNTNEILDSLTLYDEETILGFAKLICNEPWDIYETMFDTYRLEWKKKNG